MVMGEMVCSDGYFIRPLVVMMMMMMMASSGKGGFSG